MLRLVIFFLLLGACGLDDFELPTVNLEQGVGLHKSGDGLHLRMSPVADAGTGNTVSVQVALENCDGHAVTDANLQTEVVLGIKTTAGYRELERAQTDKGVAVFHFKLDEPVLAAFLHAEAMVSGKRLSTEGGPFSVDPVLAGDFFIYPRHLGDVAIGELFPVYIMSKNGNHSLNGRHKLRVVNHHGEVLQGVLGSWNMHDIHDLSTPTAGQRDKQQLPMSLREHVVARFDVFFTAAAVGKGVSKIIGLTSEGIEAIGTEVTPHANNDITMTANYDALKATTVINFSVNPNPMPNDPLRIQDQASIVYASTAPDSGKVLHTSYGNTPFSGKNGYGFWLQPANFPCSLGGKVLVKVNDRIYQTQCND
ncbi:MAG: hypothetical protein OYH77_06000 [Pseudomonadota bacterium]|nr:hypothetical protein [Pseudomonadota bacterium]